MLKTIEEAVKGYSEKLYQAHFKTEHIDDFINAMRKYLLDIEVAKRSNANEEYYKKIVNSFLEKNFYSDKKYIVNTANNIDSTIKSEDKLLVMIETKKPENKTQMVKINDLNRKAMWEILYYYLEVTRDVSGVKVRPNYDNNEITHVVITDSVKWFLFDSSDIEEICSGYLEKKFYKYRREQLTYKDDRDKFYDEIKNFLSTIDLEKKLKYIFFDMEEVYKRRRNCIYLYKILSPYFLTRVPYQPDVKTHVLKKKFFNELLYIMGLQEKKINKSYTIVLDEANVNSFGEQLYHRYNNDKDLFGESAYEKTLELIIIWLNRILFIKLFEGQLIRFNSNSEMFRILDINKIRSFYDMQNLFFNVLGKKDRDNTEFYNQFSYIPYLNSSLFERQKIEADDYNIGILNDAYISVYSRTILPKNYPKRVTLLRYLLDFLNSYDFGCGDEKQEGKKDIIDASVLGLIFEKINGYKDGSHYTKSTVTEFMAKSVVEQLIIDKVNSQKKWKCESLADIRFKLKIDASLAEYKEIDNIINSLRICDPAVGSGHFLVSILNRIIAAKAEIGVLFYLNSDDLLTEYKVYVKEDTLCITNSKGCNYEYCKEDVLSQRVQETIFTEKKKIIENCLFGVDINSKAVYICQLRLWIELLKNAYYDESGVMETLPNIDIKIKPGNSLLSKIKFGINQVVGKNNLDIDGSTKIALKEYRRNVEEYKRESNKEKKRVLNETIKRLKESLAVEYQQMALFSLQPTEELEYSLYHNALEWALEFPEILSDDGRFLGFDCIIGNPPYGAAMSEKEKEKYRNMYRDVHMRIQDTYLYFISLGARLIKKNGIISYIVPSNFLYQVECQAVRELIFEKNKVIRAINLGDGVFSSAAVPTCIFIAQNMQRNNYIFEYSDFRSVDIENIDWQLVDEQLHLNDIKKHPSKMVGISLSEQKIVERLKQKGILAGEIFDVVSQGITTGGNEAYIYDCSKIQDNNLEWDYLKPVLRGDDIQSYYYEWEQLYLAYIDKNVDISRCPNIEKLLMQSYEKLASKREVKSGRQNWYVLHWPRKGVYFENEKILMRQTGSKIICTVDRDGYYSINSTLVLNKSNRYKSWDIDVCVALLNSSIIQFQYNLLSKEEKRGFAEVKPINVKNLILPQLSSAGVKDVLVIMKELYKHIDEQKYEKITECKIKIDNIIYRECCLKKKEIEIIERIVGSL